MSVHLFIAHAVWDSTWKITSRGLLINLLKYDFSEVAFTTYIHT